MAKGQNRDEGLKRALSKVAPKRRPQSKSHRGPSKAEKAEKVRQQKVIDDAMAKGDEMILESVLPKAQLDKGHFGLVDFKIVETVHGGKVKSHTSRVIRNLGGTPVERWHSRGKLDERQMAAILFYQSAWRMWIGEPRVVANWSAVITGAAAGAVEIYAGSRIAAKESLRLLDQEVFFRLPVEHFQVWQNVVIWDEPAGIAGARIGYCHKPAEAVAQLMVATMAGMIADVVIDNSRRDFGELILNLDQPRRPRKRAT
jgi:hypothetical protein